MLFSPICIRANDETNGISKVANPNGNRRSGETSARKIRSRVGRLQSLKETEVQRRDPRNPHRES